MGIQINGQTDVISATDGSFTISGASGDLIGNLTGTASTATAAATAYGLSGSPTLSGITSVSTTNLTVNGNNYPATGPLSNRNLVINGGFQVAQRGTARVFSSSYTTLDRWAPGEYQQAGLEQVSVSDSTVPTVKGIRVTSSSTAEQAAGTRMAVGQMIESVNCVHLAGKTVTLSFYIRFSNATFTDYGPFRYYLNEYDTTADQNFGTTTPTRNNNTVITNGSLPTTWTKYTTTVTCGSAMRNLAPRFMFDNLTNTTNNSDLWYEVTAVQVEEGSVATPFEHRSYGDELARCQRYYLHIHRAGATGYGDGVGQTARSLTTITFPVEMRDGPTFSDANGSFSRYRLSSTIGESSTGLSAHYLSYVTTDAGSNYWQLTSGYFTYTAEL